jgi:predicted O-linked N-acetylglucosamine transferase (SPINDLY family)
MRSHCAVWRDIARTSDEAAETLIRTDQIDILIDLAGHTAGNRLALFARKPAPIQMTYLGYPDTTGLPAIDYRITDAVADPPDIADALHAETLLRLPPPFLCYQSPRHAPPVGELPAVAAGYVTFGSFNALPKIVPAIPLWSRILREIPTSRLLLKNAGLKDAGTCARIQQKFAEHGITADRLDLLASVTTTREHLALYNRIDLALDTFPYHGTTTTCESLWMGVPTVTLAGAVHVSRVGVSILRAIGLPELVAETPEQFARIAVQLASDQPRLAAMRSSLRQQMTASPLMDAVGFARKIEEACRTVWKRWCAI